MNAVTAAEAAMGPDHPTVALLRGRLAYARGDRTTAAALLERVERAAAGNSTLLLQIAEIHLRNRAWPRAAGAARSVLAMEIRIADRITATAYLCIASQALNKPEAIAEAADALDRALAQKQLTLHSALADLNTLNAAIAIVTVTGNIAAAQALFVSACVKRGEQPRGQIVASAAADLEAWCADNGLPVDVIEPPVDMVLPAGARGCAPAAYTTEAFLAAVIPAGEIFSGWEFAVTASGAVLGLRAIFGADFPPFCHLYSDLSRTAIYYWPAKIIDVPEAALLLPAPFRMHIGHWILDSLPRLQALTGRPHMKVAVPAELPAKHRDFLALFGIGPARLINCNLGRRYRFKELLVTQYGIAREPSPGKIKFVAGALRKPRAGPATRLFLARDTRSRSIVNLDDVNGTLAAFGFEIGCLSTMSVDAQQDRIGSADIVIATYGSDLIAAYMMQPGTDLIELNWGDLDGAAAPTCAVLGVNYHLLMCREADAEAKRYKKDSDFVVDCAALHGLLTQIMERKARG